MCMGLFDDIGEDPRYNSPRKLFVGCAGRGSYLSKDVCEHTVPLVSTVGGPYPRPLPLFD
jgi:hypothetical protein